MKDLTPPVTVFFDGVCGTCNAIVDFLLRSDRAGIFRFAPLQGESARMQLDPRDISQLQTIIIRDSEGRIYRQSDAVWRIFAVLSYPWRLLSLIRIVPRTIRDFFYQCYARNRYILGSRRDSCRVPDPSDRARFLD